MIRPVEPHNAMETDETEEASHQPVLPKEVLNFLVLGKAQVHVDGTLGLGGHARAILESIGKEGKLIGIDKDEQSIACAKENLKDYINQCVFVHGDFRDMSNILESISVKKVDSILLDLGSIVKA